MSRRGAACLAIAIASCLLVPQLSRPSTTTELPEVPGVTVYQPVLVDDLEDHTAGEIVANQSGTSWAAEAADDDLASVVADTRLNGSQCLRILDQSNANQASVTKTWNIAGVVGDYFTIGGVWPVTASLAGTSTIPVSYVSAKFREGATVVIWLAIDLSTGYVLYSTDSGATFADTGVHLALDAKNVLLDVEFNSTTTFKIRLAGGTWSSALTNDNAISTSVTKLELTTPAAHGYEGFESYVVPNSIIGGAWAWSLGGASTTFTCQTGKVGRYAADGSERAQCKYTFPTASASSPGTAWSVKTTIIGPSSGGIDWFVFDSTGPSYRVCMHSDGRILVWDATLTQFVDTGVTWSAGNSYELKAVPQSETSYDIHVNGVKAGNTRACQSSAGRTIVAVALDNYNYGGGGGQYTVTVDIDNIITSWATSGGDAGTIDCYFDDFVLQRASDADLPQLYRPVHVATDDSCHPVQGDYVDLTDYVVFNSDQGIARMTKADGSVAVVLGDAGATYAIVNAGSGVLYCAKLRYDINTAGNMKKSTDSGATWSNLDATCGSQRYAMALAWMSTGSLLCVMSMYFDAGNHVNWVAWTFDDATNTWTAEASLDTGQTVVDNSVNNAVVHNGYVSAANWFFLSSRTGAASRKFAWTKVDTTANTYTEIGDAGAGAGTSPGGDVIGGGMSVLVLDAGATLYCSGWDAGASETHIYYSVNSGTTWADLGKTGTTILSIVVFPRYEELGSRYYCYYGFATDGLVLEFNADTATLHRVLDMKLIYTDVVDVPIPITSTGYLIAEDTDGYTRTYLWTFETTEDAGIVKCELYHNIVAGGRVENRIEFASSAVDESNWQEGDRFEIYDPWSVLWFKGRIVSKSVGDGLCKLVAKDSTREVCRPYNAAFTTKKASEMLTTLTDALADGYAGTIQDVNYAGTMSYDPRLHRSWQPLLRMIRGMERAVIWVSPDGAWNLDHYDDIDATGWRWKNHDALPMALVANKSEVIDHHVTRTSVQYTGGARYVHTGNAARESIEGEVAASEHDDVAIAALADATDLATQLYNIFSTASRFSQVLVSSHGLIQPGKSIDFSWDFADTVVPRANYLIVEVHAYMLDGVQEVTLSNNILFDFEADNLELLDEQ